MAWNPPAVKQAEALQKAYNHLNACLFEPTLSQCMLVMSRNANVIGGYYATNQWYADLEDGQGDCVIPEIAININLMGQKTFVDLYVTLAHEMVHHWQTCEGTPAPMSEGHNEEWSDKAVELGMLPIGPKGESTGPLIDTKLIDGSNLERTIRTLPEEAILPWSAVELHLPDLPSGGGQGGPVAGGGGGTQRPRPKGTRAKYTCPICGMNAWAKPGLQMMCGRDSKFLVQQT